MVWQFGKCIQSGNSVRNNPAVFQPREKSWIKIEYFSTKKIIDTVKKCPWER
ncbi:(4Fe-4S)-binding protein [Flavobacterium urumqiense]|uniref:(4Fe-4S)-binding protein n=1 Tax=Flavobacterium urumqiense TaxID=935224 RepID=UPI00142DFD43|nr:(4Fe-4S)-binding protein [Flavobacterium urumqiense]